jgi:hypothetical protein
LSENTGFGFNELMHVPMEYLTGLEKQREKIIEERNKKQEEEQKENGGISGAVSLPNMSSLMSQARNMMHV